MSWYNYVFCFLGGMLLANAAPHFVNGVCGDRFPTPFARPPGKGLSSPTVNVLWAMFNLVLGFIFIRLGKVSSDDDLKMGVCFAGFAVMSILGSVVFAKKEAV
jgi:hypothetical protein